MYDPAGFAGPQAAQPLAEGVEDLQLAFGFDFNSDGNLVNVGAGAGDDDWVGNVAGECFTIKWYAYCGKWIPK